MLTSTTGEDTAVGGASLVLTSVQALSALPTLLWEVTMYR